MSSTPSQLEVFPTRLQLSRLEPGKAVQRFFRMQVQRDLFGGASLISEWGRVGVRGRVRIELHADEGRAISALLDRARLQRQRGYVL